ncbi:MAG: MFS transporter [Bacillota bacterium]
MNNFSGSTNKLFGLLTSVVFILNGGIFFFQALTKNLFPPLLLPLREAFMIDHAQAGLLVTLVFFGYALARYPSGVIADQIGCTRTVLIGGAAMALSFLGVAVSASYPVMVVMTFILGVSSGIYVTAGYTLAVVIGSREKAAIATAAFESFGIIAGISSPVLVTLFVLFFSWQLLFAVTGITLIAVTSLFFLKRDQADSFEASYAEQNGTGAFAPGKSSFSLRKKWSKSAISEFFNKIKSSTVIFKDPFIRRFIIWSTLVGGLGALSWTGINSFIPTFLVEERGYSYDIANQMYITVAVAGLAAKIGTGWLADRFGNNLVLFFNLVLSVVLFVALTLTVGHYQILVILALLGASCLNTNTLINSYVLRFMPPKYQGAGFGLFCTAYTAIYSLGPYFTGYLSGFIGLSAAIQFSSIGAVIAAALILTAGYFVPSHLVDKMASAHQ